MHLQDAIENDQALVGFEFSAKISTEKGTGSYGDQSRIDDRTIKAKDASIVEVNSSNKVSSSSNEIDGLF